MSDPPEAETESGAFSPAPPAPPSTPRLDRALCRLSWCLAGLLALLLLVAGLLCLGATHWAGWLARARVVDVKLERLPGEPNTMLATVHIAIENRTFIPFILHGLQYSVSVGTTEVHSGEWLPTVPARLAPFGSTSVEVQARLEPSRLVGAVLQGLASDRPTVGIQGRLRLGTWLGRLTVPVSIRTSLPAGELAAAPNGER